MESIFSNKALNKNPCHKLTADCCYGRARDLQILVNIVDNSLVKENEKEESRSPSAPMFPSVLLVFF